MELPAQVVSDQSAIATGGRFSVGGRRSAVAAALPLVATYFQQKGQRQFERKGGLEAGYYDTAHQQLLDALRLRVAMAAAGTMSELVGKILRRPSFRYGQVRERQVGVLRGRLDVRAYLAERGRVSEVASFPVLEVRRNLRTPENILATAAVLQIISELRSPLSRGLAVNAPDRRRAVSYVERLERDLQNSDLRDCRNEALAELRSGRMQALAELVSLRISAGHLANPEPYADVVAWVKRGRDGRPAADVGEIDWDFYDESFDTTLFEIWCLSELKSRISDSLGEPHLESRVVVGVPGPVACWMIGDLTVEVFFQKASRSIAHSIAPRWVRVDASEVTSHQGSNEIGGRPDITIRVDRHGKSRFVFLDPKLRQRVDKEPTEELYKMLGYFNNFGRDGNGVGGILYYAPFPQSLASSSFGALGQDGRLLAVALDPERNDLGADGWSRILELIL